MKLHSFMRVEIVPRHFILLEDSLVYELSYLNLLADNQACVLAMKLSWALVVCVLCMSGLGVGGD